MYEPVDEIDFGRIYSLMRDAVLFDDHFLGMQAMNIAIVDQYITDCEAELLRELRQTERTPTESGIFVSAQSQMWIFALYELLRTWTGRINRLLKWRETGGLDTMIDNLATEEGVASFHLKRHAERVKASPEFGDLMKAHQSLFAPVYQMTRDIRVNLAKHEVPGKPNRVPRSPGYGRINSLCGSLDYEVVSQDGSRRYLNRRDIADALRAVELPADTAG